MRHRSLAERIAARVVTGPLGHLHGGAVDLAVLGWAIARARVRERTPVRRAFLR